VADDSAGQARPPRVAVLGAGPGGYPAAFFAAERGFDVPLIDERGNPGGVCLYDGCIPSKALLHAAELLHDAAEAGAMGLTFGEPNIDLDRLREWKDREVVGKMTSGLAQIAKARQRIRIQICRYPDAERRRRARHRKGRRVLGECKGHAEIRSLGIGTGARLPEFRPERIESRMLLDAFGVGLIHTSQFQHGIRSH